MFLNPRLYDVTIVDGALMEPIMSPYIVKISRLGNRSANETFASQFPNAMLIV